MIFECSQGKYETGKYRYTNPWQKSWCLFLILMILASYEAKTAKISNFQIFWSITLLIYGLLAEIQARMS